jgi:hypothetical protein
MLSEDGFAGKTQIVGPFAAVVQAVDIAAVACSNDDASGPI